MGNPEDSNHGELVVLRIAAGSTTDKQGHINVGDIIAEVNNVPVSTAEQLGDVIQRSGPDIKFKVIPEGARATNGVENRVSGTPLV